jgi:hypothetical protein
VQSVGKDRNEGEIVFEHVTLIQILVSDYEDIEPNRDRITQGHVV